MIATVERWHVSQYAAGQLVTHTVFNEYESGLGFIRRKGLFGGSNVLARASKCECRGMLK